MKNGNFKSLSKDQAKRCISFFLKESFNYKNFDEHGRYIPRSKRNNSRRIFNNKKQNIEQDKVSEQKQEQIVENTNQQNSTNVPSPTIQLSDEQTLHMILKVVLIILNFVKGALDDSSENE